MFPLIKDHFPLLASWALPPHPNSWQVTFSSVTALLWNSKLWEGKRVPFACVLRLAYSWSYRMDKYAFKQGAANVSQSKLSPLKMSQREHRGSYMTTGKGLSKSTGKVGRGHPNHFPLHLHLYHYVLGSAPW